MSWVSSVGIRSTLIKRVAKTDVNNSMQTRPRDLKAARQPKNTSRAVDKDIFNVKNLIMF